MFDHTDYVFFVCKTTVLAATKKLRSASMLG
jgi:hypothetical protein